MGCAVFKLNQLVFSLERLIIFMIQLFYYSNFLCPSQYLHNQSQNSPYSYCIFKRDMIPLVWTTLNCIFIFYLKDKNKVIMLAINIVKN